MRKIKIDHQYMAYLLLEMLYKEGKVNKDTYDAVMAEKERYLRMVKAGENSPSKYRISEPFEIVTEFDIKVKLNNLTNMRMEGEISKVEYQEYRQKVTDEIATFQKKLKALVEERKEPDPAVIKMSLDEFAAILVEKIDFSAPIIDRGIIEQFVEKIVPRNTLEFDWYLILIPHIFEEYSSTGYNEVWTFVINFDEAEKYRKLRGGFLRKNQWRDLTVHVFV